MQSLPFITPEQLHIKLPVKDLQADFIAQSRLDVHNILTDQDPRFLLIVGPCSIHDIKGAKEYAERLTKLSAQVKDSFLIIMRAYVEKPRTALGWKGLMHDPLLDGSNQIELGYEISRELLLYLADLKLPAACEFLDPSSFIYHEDLITWGCVGARTSSSQVHRQMASDINLPIAFKNSTDGNIETAVNGCLAATYPHSFLGLNHKGLLTIRRSKGNPDAHVVLRGAEGKPNYDSISIRKALHLLSQANLRERVIIDCSHDNCEKKHELQKNVFENALKTALHEISSIKGMMLESYLQAGNQPLAGPLPKLQFGVSVTDSCLSWESTETLIQAAHAQLQAENRL
jgi:3-deoxy-7-phosphoheptulonate synthase